MSKLHKLETELKPASYEKLQPGDPWVFINEGPIYSVNNKPIEIGDVVSSWFATCEPGRLFEVIRVTEAAYETVFVGFDDTRLK